MTFMHMGTVTAASSVGGIVGFAWTDTAPYSTIRVDDGGDGFWAEAVFTIGGEGNASPFPTLGAYAGGYTTWEHNFLQGTAAWLNPAFVGNIDQYFFRTIDITVQSDGNVPGQQVAYAGVWTDTRTDWRSLAIVSPHTNMTADPLAQWACEAQGAFGSAYDEEQLDCIVEIGSQNGQTELFDFGDVDTGNDEIVLTSHAFETGDQVIYTIGSGGAPAPMLDQTMYSVRKITDDRISIGNNLVSIDATPAFLNLTTQGAGTGHSFQRIDAEASVVLTMDTSI